MNDIQRLLYSLRACEDAVRWAGCYDEPLAAWHECHRGDWLLWVASKSGVSRELIVLAACACVRLALPYTTDERPLRAIEMAEQWAAGDPRPPLNMVIEPAEVAEAASRAAYANADAATYRAAYAASRPACVAVAAAGTTYAAEAAAEAATYAAYTSCLNTLAKCANLVREHIDEATILSLWQRHVHQKELQETG